MNFQYNLFDVLTPLSYSADVPEKLSESNEASPSANASEFGTNISLMLQDVPESDEMPPSELNSLDTEINQETDIEIVIESQDEANQR